MCVHVYVHVCVHVCTYVCVCVHAHVRVWELMQWELGKVPKGKPSTGTECHEGELGMRVSVMRRTQHLGCIGLSAMRG